MSSKDYGLLCWYSSQGSLRCALPGEVAERPSGFLFLRFGIDLLTVHGKIRGEQLPEVLCLIADNEPAAHGHPDQIDQALSLSLKRKN